MRIFHRFCFGAMVLSSVTANAESVFVHGRKLELAQPVGFCPLGDTSRETKLLEMQRRNVSPAGELAQFSVSCDELSEFQKGNLESFSVWAQVLVLRRHGKFSLVFEKREQFVRAIAGNVSTRSVDLAETSRRANEHLAQAGVRVQALGMEPIGIRDSAFFATMRLKAEANGVTEPMVAVVAVTVANRLPVAVQVYGNSRASGMPLASIAATYVSSVVNQNSE